MLLSLPASPALPRTSISLQQGKFGVILVQIGEDSAISLALRTGQPSSMTTQITLVSISHNASSWVRKSSTRRTFSQPFCLTPMVVTRSCKQWRPRTKPGRPGEMISIIISSGSSQLRPSNMLSESLISHGWHKRLLSAPGYQKAQ